MIKLSDVTKRYGANTVYENFNLDVEENKITVILGESGSGKTTLMNILLGETDYSGKVENMPKDLSVVFQNNVLVPNLTVEENIRLVSPSADVDELLMTVGLSKNKHDYPKSLSAGMKRRVAIARALSKRSPVIMMDEPFVNLDLSLRYHLIDVIRRRVKENGQTLIVITHDIKEAVTLADRIIVLSKGQKIFDTSNVNERTEKEIFDVMLSIKNF